MKLDLHIHCSERSSCSVSPAEEMMAAARAAGLDGMAFSDHDRLAPRSWLEAVNRERAPFHVFTGIEVTTSENEHVLVIGLADPALEKRGWSYLDLRRYVRERGAFAALAHAFRFQDIPPGVRDDPPDALELYSSNISDEHRPRIARLRDETGCPVIGASDAHHSRMIGRYWIELEAPAANDAELVSLLKAGKFTPVCRHEPGS